MAKRTPGSTFKKNGKLYRVSSSGKPFVSSNSKKAQQQRALNARLDQPVAAFQGPQGVIASPTTERDLAHQAATATKIQYGPSEAALAQQLQQAVQQQANTKTYYEDYKKRLQGYQQQVAGYQQGFREAMANLPGAVQGLGQQAYGQVQQQQGAMPQGTANVPGDVAQNASNANAIGQAAAANWAAYANATANANNQYAGNLANVVAPGQQLVALNQKQGAINQVKQKQTDLAGQEGAYNQNYRTTQRQNEQKNLLAQATLGVNAANDQAKLDLARQTLQQGASDKAASRSLQRRQQNLAHQDRMTGQQISKMNSDRTYQLNKQKFGATQAKDKWQREHHTGPYAPGGSKSKKGPDWVTAQQQNEKGGFAARMKGLAHQLQVGHPPSQKDKDGNPVYPPGVDPKNPNKRLNRQQAAAVLRQNPDMDEAILSAVLDANYDGHLSRYTVKKLIAAGYKPSGIASALGVPTPGKMGRSTRPKIAPGKSIPGLGATLP